MATANSDLPETMRPSGRVLWWGGLATVAVLGIVDWPVAALVGVGTWVARRDAEQRVRESLRQAEAVDPGDEPA